MRWIVEIISDAKAGGIKNWRMFVLDRKKWKKLLEKVKTHYFFIAPVILYIYIYIYIHFFRGAEMNKYTRTNSLK